MLLNHVMVGL